MQATTAHTFAGVKATKEIRKRAITMESSFTTTTQSTVEESTKQTTITRALSTKLIAQMAPTRTAEDMAASQPEAVTEATTGGAQMPMPTGTVVIAEEHTPTATPVQSAIARCTSTAASGCAVGIRRTTTVETTAAAGTEVLSVTKTSRKAGVTIHATEIANAETTAGATTATGAQGTLIAGRTASRDVRETPIGSLALVGTPLTRRRRRWCASMVDR